MMNSRHQHRLSHSSVCNQQTNSCADTCERSHPNPGSRNPLHNPYSRIELPRCRSYHSSLLNYSPPCQPTAPSLSSTYDNLSCSALSHETENMKLSSLWTWISPRTVCPFVILPRPPNHESPTRPCHPDNSSSAPSISARC